MAAIGNGLATHAVGGIEQLPEAECFAERVRQADRRLQRLFQHFGGQDPFAVVFPIVHQGDEPVGELIDIGDDGAGGRDAFGIFVIGDFVELKGVALFAEGHAVIGVFVHVVDAVGGRFHVERREDFFADELLPALPRLQFDNFADGGEHEVVVQEGLTHGLLRLEIFQAIEQFFASERRFKPDEVVARDSAAMGEHVAKSDVVVELIVIELDGGNGFANGLVPCEFAFFDQHAGSDSGEELGV